MKFLLLALQPLTLTRVRSHVFLVVLAVPAVAGRRLCARGSPGFAGALLLGFPPTRSSLGVTSRHVMSCHVMSRCGVSRREEQPQHIDAATSLSHSANARLSHSHSSCSHHSRSHSLHSHHSHSCARVVLSTSHSFRFRLVTHVFYLSFRCGVVRSFLSKSITIRCIKYVLLYITLYWIFYILMHISKSPSCPASLSCSE